MEAVKKTQNLKRVAKTMFVIFAVLAVIMMIGYNTITNNLALIILVVSVGMAGMLLFIGASYIDEKQAKIRESAATTNREK